MNRLLFQFFRRSSSLLSTTVIRTYSSRSDTIRDAIRLRIISREGSLLSRSLRHICRDIPVQSSNLHQQIQSLINDRDDLNAASVTLRDAVISGIVPLGHTCSILLESMCDSSRYEDAISLFNSVYKDSKLMPTVDDYICLIRAYGGTGRAEEALQVYHKIRDSMYHGFDLGFDLGTYRYLTQGLVAANRISDAMEILREMLAICGAPVDPIAYSHVISAYLQLNDVESAKKLFNELVQSRLSSGCYEEDGVVYATLMDYYFENNMEKEAMELYQAFLGCRRRMATEAYNALLEVFLKYGKVAEADNLFKEMIDISVSPNVTTFRILFDAYGVQNRTDDLLKWFNYMLFKADYLKPKSEFLNSVFSKLINKGRIEEAAEILEKMPVRNEKTFPASSYELILAELCRQGKVDRVQDLLHIKKKNNISITMMVHGIIHEAFANAKRSDQIEEMLGMPIEAGCGKLGDAHVFQHLPTMPVMKPMP